MAELTFPLTNMPKPPWNLSSEEVSISSDMEAGFVVKRSKYTRARDQLSDVVWDVLDLDVLVVQDFYKNITKNGSLPFTLSISTPNTTFTRKVMFSQPPTHRYVGIGVFETTCSFKEV